MAKKFSLKKLFAATVFGAGALITPAFMPGNDNDATANDHVTGVGEVSTASQPVQTNNHDEVWARVLKEYGTHYDYTKPTKQACDPNNTTAIQVETTYDLYGITLNPFASPMSVLSSHGASAAKITDETADFLAGQDVGVCFLESVNDIDQWFFSPSSPDARAMFSNTKVVTLSMGVPAGGNQDMAFSYGALDSAEEILEADRFWDQTHAIFVWSAGNSGADITNGPERPEASMMIRIDTMAKVGAGFMDRMTGRRYVEPYSSMASPSFVTTNPYYGRPDLGIFSYPYFKDAEGVRDRLEEYFAKTMPGAGGLTAKEVFIQNLKALPDDKDMTFGGDPLKKCHVRFETAEFEGKEALLKDRAWQREHAEEVFEAYKNGLIDSAKYARWYMRASENGMMDRLDGTSFTAPYAGGLFAAMAVKYPELSEHDLTMAAIMASNPWGIELRAPDGTFRKLSFRDNGRGLMHDELYAGFGFLDEAKFEEIVSRMAAMQKEDPSLASKQMKADSGMVRFGTVKRYDPSSKEDGETVENKTAEIVSILQKDNRRFEPMVIDPLRALSENDDSDSGNNGDGSGSVFADPVLNTDPVSTGGVCSEDSAPVWEYQIEVTDDIVAGRANLQIRFKDGVFGTPGKITLVSPSGGETFLSVTKIRSMDMQYALTTTDAPAGNYTKGTWLIRVSGAQIEQARLLVHGTQKGGVIDRMIDKKLHEEMARTPERVAQNDGWKKVTPVSSKLPAPKL